MLGNDQTETEKRLRLIFYWFIACSILCIAPNEVMAFAQPIVTKANRVKDNLILIAKACVGIGMIVFVFSLIVSRPMWKLCVCLLSVGAIIGAFSAFYGFIINA